VLRPQRLEPPRSRSAPQTIQLQSDPRDSADAGCHLLVSNNIKFPSGVSEIKSRPPSSVRVFHAKWLKSRFPSAPSARFYWAVLLRQIRGTLAPGDGLPSFAVFVPRYLHSKWQKRANQRNNSALDVNYSPPANQIPRSPCPHDTLQLFQLAFSTSSHHHTHGARGYARTVTRSPLNARIRSNGLRIA